MNDADTIRAARDMLIVLRESAFGGRWDAYHSGIAQGESIAYISANDGSDEDYRRPTADLIATLHGTIDAQIALFESALWLMKGDSLAYTHAAVYGTTELAKAILGGTT